jgi:hypothetical protein
MAKPQPGFVVKAATATGLEMWVSVARAGGHRTFGPRENADVFKTRLEAHSAIKHMPPAFVQSGFTFTVETAE